MLHQDKNNRDKLSAGVLGVLGKGNLGLGNFKWVWKPTSQNGRNSQTSDHITETTFGQLAYRNKVWGCLLTEATFGQLDHSSNFVQLDD